MKILKQFFFFIFIISYVLSSGQEKAYPKIDTALSRIYFQSINTFDFNNGIRESTKLINESKKLNYKKGIAKGSLNIGNFLVNLNRYKEALIYLEIAEKNNLETEDFLTRSEIYTEYGKVYGMLNLHQRAIDYFNKAINENKKVKDSHFKVLNLQIAYACKAESSRLISQYDSTYIYFKKAYALDPDPITGANIADYFINYKKEHIDSAEYYLKAAEVNYQQKKYDPFQKLAYLLVYGDYYFQKEEYNKSLEKYLETEKMSAQLKRPDVRVEAYASISKIYLKLNNPQKSAVYLKMQADLSDSLKTINNIALDLSVEKLIKEKEHEKLKETETLSKKNSYILGAVILITILIIIWGYLFYIRKKREKEVLINDQRELIQKKETENKNLEFKVNDAFEEVMQLAKKNSPHFLARFKEVYPEFCQKIIALQPDLLNSELTFCAYLKLNFTTKEIATYTFVTEKAVQGRKSRIRKKFNISSDEDLYMWFKKIDS
ncbi:tetratricopeptide repeat protein [Chryseobacterium formosus]|uniref:Tetratricopeptide repeat protein n=1 Tax=Chryseobacterium formosus TaxID=1537363 RepID=A0ABT3XUL3_9FLAO|nr:tetratricopeptide repeat protein [Chryseobacterium formosus]MCX8525363.1 tetratricopeptide repeat protein [Chryseobacterium formosus]